MSIDRRVGAGHPGPDRAVIDDILFERKTGSHARPCAICGVLIPAGTERYIPIRSADRHRLVDGRNTRLCPSCVEGRLAAARGAA